MGCPRMLYEFPPQFQVDFSKPPACYWSDSAKMSYLQRRIIVYSIMYYEHSESCVSDKFYDGISHQLVNMAERVGWEEYRKTTYYYCMYDFDASTGFHLYSRLTKYDKDYLTNIAGHVYESWKKAGKPQCK